MCKRRDLPLKSLAGAAEVLREPDLKKIAPEAVKLVRLHFIVPATSCTAERSFSQLRRLKNWLRTTMTQTRLNHAAVCAVHAEVLMEIDLKPLMREFAMRSVQRVKVFGKL